MGSLPAIDAANAGDVCTDGGDAVKLGEVLAKERQRQGMSADEVAVGLGIPLAEYQDWEAGRSAAERWGPILAKIAVKLETPVSRLLTETGKAADTTQGQAAKLIADHRKRKGLSAADLSGWSGCTAEELAELESGRSAIEEVGPRLLRFAELIHQPVFNLLYPCGLPFEAIEDYP
jgi:transcriptional regulator with XRE-family HTH domain